jgi:UDP-N-acetyl-D-galactosamine dehydrogenase
MNLKLKDIRLCIIGLGYVGLPLAVAFGRKRNVIGYDLDKKRILELKKAIDKTSELSKNEIRKAKKLRLSYSDFNLKECNCFIVAVPTPIDKNNMPDLELIKKASRLVGKSLSKNTLVIYESTVYPGLTEEVCVPILSKFSGLEFNKDFFVGYSPERINPGDKKHKLENIVKVTSGSTDEAATLVDKLYASIITAGTYKAPSIKVAEAAKVIENTQRDLNIALINELAIVFNKLKINTLEVLKAAETKWNFIPFRPGLVGGHCIGVDPYYFTFKSKQIGYSPKVILSGRKINDSMSKYIASQIIKKIKKEKLNLKKSKILILGFSFKENCSDIRNTKVLDIVNNLKNKVLKVDVFDPVVNLIETKNILGAHLIKKPKNNYYDFILIAVSHEELKLLGIKKIKEFGKKKSFIFDLKNISKKNEFHLVDMTL